MDFKKISYYIKLNQPELIYKIHNQGLMWFFFHGKSKNRGVQERNEGKERKLNRHQTRHHHHTSIVQKKRECQDASNDMAYILFCNYPHMLLQNGVMANVLTHVVHVLIAFYFFVLKDNITP